MTANPAKLAKIGKELEKLGKEINMMTPVSEVPFPTRLVQENKVDKKLARSKMFVLINSKVSYS